MGAATVAAASAGCGGPLSALDPAGPAAATIATLWWVMFVGAVLVLGIVMALLGIALRPARAARPTPPTQSLSGARLWLVGGGVVFPSVVLLALLVYGLLVGERLIAQPGVGRGADGATVALRVTAEASRWQWTFGYPSLGDATHTVGRLHIPTGRPVEVLVSSRDVIHSFWVPRLAGKVDAIPGRTNVLRLEAREPGIHAGLCAEYCGTGHARHGFEVEAHDPDDWARAVAQGAPRAAAPEPGRAPDRTMTTAP